MASARAPALRQATPSSEETGARAVLFPFGLPLLETQVDQLERLEKHGRVSWAVQGDWGPTGVNGIFRIDLECGEKVLRYSGETLDAAIGAALRAFGGAA